MDTLIPKRDRLCRNRHYREQTTALVLSRPCLIHVLSVRCRRRRLKRDAGKTSEYLVTLVRLNQK